MTKEEVRNYFDRCAPGWDEKTYRDEEAIRRILDNAGVKKGVRILDAACGTGALFGDYLNRGAEKVTAVDLSPEMVRVAKRNYQDARIDVICGDIEEYDTEERYDVCMVYNAFPHFAEPAALLENLARLAKPGGRISVAHGMSRERLRQHHNGAASKVSVELPEAKELAGMMAAYADVDCIISDASMYQVVGVKK